MAGRRPSRVRVLLLLAAALACTALLCALGVWQVERLSWKLDLIARVEARIGAEPVPAPGPALWDAVTPASSEYLRVRVTGRFQHDKETLVQAVTDLGPGHWVLTPLATGEGFVVLVNRGFVPPQFRDPAARAAGLVSGEVTVTGLLRMSEPGGGFLHANDPEGDRWYSRDVAAIAATRGLEGAAPYFIDAEASTGDWPVGGLTRVVFNNNHLVYALTWFALALMTFAAGCYVLHDWRGTADPPDGKRPGSGTAT